MRIVLPIETAANFPSTIESAAQTAAQAITRRLFVFFIKNSLRRCPSAQARRVMSEYMRSGMRTPNRKGKPFSSDRQLPVRRHFTRGVLLFFLFYIGKYSTLHSRCQSPREE